MMAGIGFIAGILFTLVLGNKCRGCGGFKKMIGGKHG